MAAALTTHPLSFAPYLVTLNKNTPCVDFGLTRDTSHLKALGFMCYETDLQAYEASVKFSLTGAAPEDAPLSFAPIKPLLDMNQSG